MLELLWDFVTSPKVHVALVLIAVMILRGLYYTIRHDPESLGWPTWEERRLREKYGRDWGNRPKK